jgi:cytochrome P450
MTTTSKVPPGPSGMPLLGNVLDFKRDTVSAIVGGWREYGDTVRFRGVGPFFPIYLFTRPEHIEYVFQDNFRNYRRQDFLRKKFGMVVGNGLVTVRVSRGRASASSRRPRSGVSACTPWRRR